MFVYVHICIERNNGILYTHLIHGRQPIQTILERLSAQGGKAIKQTTASLHGSLPIVRALSLSQRKQDFLCWLHVFYFMPL